MHPRQLPLAFLALIVFCLSAAPAVRADEIALWNFNDSNLVVDRGVGLLTTTANPANVTFFGGTTLNARMGDPAGQALAIQGGANLQNNGSFLELRVSTAGFSNIQVTWAGQRSDTGFTNIQTQYSIDGINFINDFATGHTTNVFAFFGSALGESTGTWNNPLFAYRWVLTGATNAAGNVRFDNIVVDGVPRQPVPEPATMLLLATGLAGVAAKVRRRRSARDRK